MKNKNWFMYLVKITESIKRKLGDYYHSSIDNGAEFQKESQLPINSSVKG